MKTAGTPFLLPVLALVLSIPALAADPVPSSVRKRPAVVREAAPAARVRPVVDVEPSDQQAQGIYQTLLGEIALQRGDLELASAVYFDLAKRTRQPQALERAIEVAGHARKFDLAREAARWWLEIDPGAKRAQQMLISVLLLNNQFDELAPLLVRMLQSDSAVLGENLLGLNRMFARTADRQAVFKLIDEVCRPFVGIAEGHYAVAMAASSAGAFDRALVESRRALELRPEWEAGALLRAQLLSRDSAREALAFLQEFVEKNPGARDAQLTLARTLIGEQRYDESKRLFDQLLQSFPDNPDVVFPAAVLALQLNDLPLAETRFRHLLTLQGADKATAFFFLGQIAEDTGRAAEALALFERVEPGDRYVTAQLRRANLLAGQGRLDEARALLSAARARTAQERVRLVVGEATLLREANQIQAAFDVLDKALAGQPDEPDYLYESALMAERLGKLEVLETRLRRLIELRPDHAQAFNALGYSLAERNLRLDEARSLIEKALQLAPEDAFILDSMGWVVYRQGDLPAALAYLERAYARRADAEVAAHIGEVLWMLGRRDEARKMLLEAQQKHPDHPVLREAVRKFAP